jgi:nucleoside-diphosphate-sugar epimerase
MTTHIVIGSGPVGSGVALELAARGEHVTVVTRSGRAPSHPLVNAVAADAADASRLTAIAQGAATIFNCANPPYHRWADDWPPLHRSLLTAAERTGAVLVMIDNLYSHGPDTPMPMAEHTPMTATGRKGAIRATMASELLAAHADGRVRATLARASDYYGPNVLDASLGERVVPRLLAGKKVTVLGSLDTPHVVSYMPDVVRTLVTIATTDTAWGRPWLVPNAPARTQRQVLKALADAAGTDLKAAALPRAMLTMTGPFWPLARELKETWYQFAEPWTTNSTLTETTFGLTPTSLEEGAATTVAWWRQRGAS